MDHFSRFGAVVAAAEKVDVMDSSNHEVSPLLCRARGAANAGSIGNERASKLGSIEQLLLTNGHNQLVALICKINNVAKKFIPTSEPKGKRQ